MNSPSYNLSDIPGFNNIITSGDFTIFNVLKLNKVECRTLNKASYKVIRYDKSFLSFDLICLIRSL